MRYKPKGFILDVDGTIASHMKNGEPMRAHYDYEKVKDDEPIPSVIEMVNILVVHMEPIVVSGRMDTGDCRVDTYEWIVEYVGIKGFPLFMRPAFLPNGKPDYRPDYIVKEEIYNTKIKDNWDIRFAIDDRLQVCRQWYAMGIPVFRVGDPDANF